MLDKIVKEAITDVVGKQAAEIINFLDSKKYINEFLIAKKMDITVNQVRNILYKLSDNGLVSSTRKKDKRKGWYTYFWKVEGLKSLEFLKSMLIKKIEQINYQVKSRETKNFYVCEKCNIEFNEETALLYDFTCNECGGVFSMKDNTKVLNEFNKTLDKLKKKLSLVEVEIKKEKEIFESKRQRELVKEEKEKQKKKAVQRAARKKLNKKVKSSKNKKTLKRVVKKKPAKKKVSKTKTPKKAKLKKKVESSRKKRNSKKIK